MEGSAWNVHNFDLSSADLALVTRLILEDLEKASANPLSFTVILLGDFNFPGDSHQKFSYSSPHFSSAVGGGSAAANRAHPANFSARDSSSIFFNGVTTENSAAWKHVFNKMIEITQPCPTHYCSGTNCGRTIDRSFTLASMNLTRW